MAGRPPRQSGRGRGRGTPQAGQRNVGAASTSVADELIPAFRNVALTDSPERPLRPGFGTLGRSINLRANFYALDMPKVLYEYRISMSPDEKRKPVRLRILQLLDEQTGYKDHIRYTVHDKGDRLISARMLPQPLDIPVRFYEDGERGPRPNAKAYTVSIELVQELDWKVMNQYLSEDPRHRANQVEPFNSASNLIIQRHASKTGVRVGKNRYFFPDARKFDLPTFGLFASRGYFISVRETPNQLRVNVNTCMSAFYFPGNLAEAIMAYQRQSHGAPLPSWFCQKIRVTMHHTGHKMRKILRHITNKNAQQARFQCQEYEGKITVKDFFQRKYNIRLKHPNLPVADVGNAGREVFVPPELCFIEDCEPFRGVLSGDDTAAMLKLASNSPARNADFIKNDGLRRLGLPDTQLATDFGYRINMDMTSVPARVLPSPRVAYRGKTTNTRDGSWNILDVKFQRGGDFRSWAVLIVRDKARTFGGPDDTLLIRTLRSFKSKFKAIGMSVPAQPPKIFATPVLSLESVQDPYRDQAIEQIRQTLRNNLDPSNKPSFVLVVLSLEDKHIRSGIKQLCDVRLGIHTVCVLFHKLTKERGQDQYLSNVALKINMKLGGVNHLLDPESLAWLMKQKTMLVGMDVTHPGPHLPSGTPSIAAVVSSVDDSFVHFPATLRIQKPNKDKKAKEMTEYLTEMMVERLQEYKRRNSAGGKGVSALPERVIVYRDGVSEGQFDVVLREELPKIKRAFQQISPQQSYQPQLAIIICGKRHHTRFFPTDAQSVDKKGPPDGNPPPGTVVDRVVTAPYDHDFYLQAHFGLQGTARPTHYTVIYDEIGLGANELQQGTHAFSYLYARATKAVSLAPPAYYADLAAEHARCYLRSAFIPAGQTRGRSLNADEIFENAEKLWGEGVHGDLRNSMFYI